MLENKACYKVKIDFVNKSVIAETDTIDFNGLTNAWLTNSWKQFFSMPFVSYFFPLISVWNGIHTLLAFHTMIPYKITHKCVVNAKAELQQHL